MLSTQIIVQSYTWTHFQFIALLNLMFCIQLVNLATYECTFSTFVNLTTNLYTFRIFVQKNTTFMQNVDFKSDL